MKCLCLDEFKVYPRVSMKCLDNLTQLRFQEYKIDMSQKCYQIQALLIKLIEECLGELRREFSIVYKSSTLQKILTQQCCLYN